MRQKRATRFITAILFTCFLASAGTFIYGLGDYFGIGTETEPQVIEAVSSQQNAYSEQTANSLAGSFQKEHYSGQTAWLEIPDTTVNNAVMQYTDDEYYLTHKETGEKSVYGCYFAFHENDMTSVSSLDRVTIIYGHSNASSKYRRFGALKQYKNAEFAKNHQFIYLTISGVKTIWQVFAAGDYPIDPSYVIANPDDDYFLTECSSMAKHSYNNYSGISVGVEDKVLILSTCTGNKQYDTRFIVCAKLISTEGGEQK